MQTDHLLSFKGGVLPQSEAFLSRERETVCLMPLYCIAKFSNSGENYIALQNSDEIQGIVRKKHVPFL